MSTCARAAPATASSPSTTDTRMSRKPRSRTMRERPIEFTRLAIQRPRLQGALADAGDRQHLGGVATGENLVGALEIGILHHGLDHRDAGLPHQLDDALTGDAV